MSAGRRRPTTSHGAHSDRWPVAGRRWPALVLLLLACLVSAPAFVLAHAQVVSSTPADGSSAPAGLKTITIHFSEDVSPDQSVAKVTGPGGADITGLAVVVDRADRTVMNIYTQPLAEGKYMVEWAAVTENDNGHTGGRFSFTVASGSGTSLTETSTTNTTSATSDLSAATNPGQAWLISGAALATLLLGLAVWVVVRRRM